MTKLEAIDDSLGPLGPLGEDAPIPMKADDRPTPPQKEQTAAQNARQAAVAAKSTSSLSGMLASVDLDDENIEPSGRPRIPPPVQPSIGGGIPRRDTTPSVSIEQAAKPSFDISVGDPHKVGDAISSHIVYQVKTKVYSCSIAESKNC